MLLNAINDPAGPPSEIPVRPLTGTKPGCIYAEACSHKRPFPKRHGVPYDRWRNSGGKRGATVIRGRRTVFVRRYGNVWLPYLDPRCLVLYLSYNMVHHSLLSVFAKAVPMLQQRTDRSALPGATLPQVICHDLPSVRYVEYSVVLDRDFAAPPASQTGTKLSQAADPRSRKGASPSPFSPLETEELTKSYRLYHTPPLGAASPAAKRGAGGSKPSSAPIDPV